LGLHVSFGYVSMTARLKAIAGITSLSSSFKKTAQYDESVTATTFGAILAKEPAAREEEEVREALHAWLEHLPLSGAALSVELQAPESALLEAFQRGRLVVGQRGQRLQDEGDEVRHYTIVLQGKCRLRCRLEKRARTPVDNSGSGGATGSSPSAKADGAGNADGEGGASAQIEKDGYALCDNVGRGESLGLTPGEPRSLYEAHCAERSVLLVLGQHDYAASLQTYHHQLRAQIVGFLDGHRLCPQAGSQQVKKMASFCRHRTVRRGTVVAQAGDVQRHVRILKSGSCSMLASEIDAAVMAAENAEEGEASSNDEEERNKHNRLRGVSKKGREKQQAQAAAEYMQAAVLKYSRGKDFRRSLQGRPEAPLVGGAAPGPDANLKTVACVSNPGAILGEEALLYDKPAELLGARYLYTYKADEDCSFYTLDLTAWRSFAMYKGQENVSAAVSDNNRRRGSTLGRSQNVTRHLNQNARRLQRREAAREDRQKIRLPGNSGVSDELENLDDWLSVTLQQRKQPFNERNPTNLMCLEALGLDSLKASLGPGTDKIKNVFSDTSSVNQWRLDNQRRRRRYPGQLADSNPMGETLPANARYSEVLPPTSLAIEDEYQQFQATLPYQSRPELDQTRPGGIFFQTEPELEDVPEEMMWTQETLPKSSSVPQLPQLHGSHDAPEDELMRTMSQLALRNSKPTFRRVKSSSALVASSAASVAAAFSATESVQSSSAAPPLNRQQRVVRAFKRSLRDKSVLVLTDQGDVKRKIAELQLSADFGLCFVKSTNELVQRLADKKEHHDALLVDLSKKEMQIESVMRLIRGHQKYGKMPVIVISSDHDLPELVRKECSFVVFKPLALPTLREALVWCFDRKTLKGYFQQEGGTDQSLLSATCSGTDQSRLTVNHSFFLSSTPVFA